MCVVSDDRPRQTTACVRYGEPIEHAFFLSTMHGSVLYESTTRVCRVRMYGITVCIHRRPRPSRELIRACEWEWDDGMDGWMDAWHSFIHFVCRRRARRRTDSRDAPSATIDIVRIERVSPASLPLSLSLSRTTNSFIHSFIPLRTNERTNEGTNERTNDRTRSRGTRERDGLDRRVRSHPIARAREEVRASVSNARRIERIESRVHFKPPHRRRSRRMQ